MKEKEKKNTIVKRMIFAVAAGFVVGFLMLFRRDSERLQGRHLSHTFAFM